MHTSNNKTLNTHVAILLQEPAKRFEGEMIPIVEHVENMQEPLMMPNLPMQCQAALSIGGQN